MYRPGAAAILLLSNLVLSQAWEWKLWLRGDLIFTGMTYS